MRPTLEIAGAAFPLRRRTQVAGRPDPLAGWSPDIDLTAYDSGRTVSRRHAEIACDGSTVTIRDLGGPNGTFVDGVRIAAGATVALAQAAEVGFGEVSARYAAEGAWPDGMEPEWQQASGPPEPPDEAGQTMVGPRGAPSDSLGPPAPRRRWPRLPFR